MTRHFSRASTCLDGFYARNANAKAGRDKICDDQHLLTGCENAIDELLCPVRLCLPSDEDQRLALPIANPAKDVLG